MNTLPIIFQAEFLRKVRSRPFIIGTVIGMLAVAGIVFLPGYLGKMFNANTKSIILAGDPALIVRAKPLLAKDFDIVATPRAPLVPPTIADLDRANKASAYVVLEKRASGLHATAYARDASTFRGAFARDLVPLNIELSTHLAQSRIDPLLTVPVDIKGLDAKFKTESASNSARSIAYILVIFLYLAILLNSQSVMASVAEEKTSRIAELLVATTSPMMLLAGKILAGATISILQLAAWLGAGYFAAMQSAAGAAQAASKGDTSGADFAIFGSLDISTGIILAFAAFFILGFLQYVTLYAAAASLINRTEDLGSVSAPLVIPVLAAYFLALATLGFPNDPRVAIFSEIPLLSPFVMFTRMTVSTVPTWQIILAIIINIAAVAVIIWGAGKVYRVGLLMYGRPPSLKQVITALRA
jgi:ABC-2 type transport system permease protein